MLQVVLLLALTTCGQGLGPVDLTAASWTKAVWGKRVLIAFNQRGCPYCEDLKEIWGNITELYKDTPGILVADVDCSDGGPSEALCFQQSVALHPAIIGTPTIRYGNPHDMTLHEGGYLDMEVDELKQIAEKAFAPFCSPAHMDLCSDEQRKEIEELQKMDSKDMETKIDETEQMLADAVGTYHKASKEESDNYTQSFFIAVEKHEADTQAKKEGAEEVYNKYLDLLQKESGMRSLGFEKATDEVYRKVRSSNFHLIKSVYEHRHPDPQDSRVNFPKHFKGEAEPAAAPAAEPATEPAAEDPGPATENKDAPGAPAAEDKQTQDEL